MTIPPLAHPEREGYVLTTTRGLRQVLGLDRGDQLRAAYSCIVGSTATLTGDLSGPADPDREALRAAIVGHRHALDALDLLAATVHRRASTLAGHDPAEQRHDSVTRLLESAAARLDELQSRSDDLDSQPAAAAAASAAPPAPATPPDGEPSGTMRNLMQLVDRLGAAAAERDDPDPLLVWLHVRMVETLGLEGVTLIEDDGVFDPVRHQIIDTVPAEHPDQADRIQATLRPGFQLGDHVLRPQQVVLWQAS